MKQSEAWNCLHSSTGIEQHHEHFPLQFASIPMCCHVLAIIVVPCIILHLSCLWLFFNPTSADNGDVKLGLDRAGTTHVTLNLHLAVGQVASITLRSKMVRGFPWSNMHVPCISHAYPMLPSQSSASPQVSTVPSAKSYGNCTAHRAGMSLPFSKFSTKTWSTSCP